MWNFVITDEREEDLLMPLVFETYYVCDQCGKHQPVEADDGADDDRGFSLPVGWWSITRADFDDESAPMTCCSAACVAALVTEAQK